MDLIKETLEKLSRLVLEEFPDYTSASFSVDAAGYLSISVVKWDRDVEKPVEDRKRRELFDQYRCSGKDSWSDQKDEQNAYYEKIGALLEESDE